MARPSPHTIVVAAALRALLLSSAAWAQGGAPQGVEPVPQLLSQQSAESVEDTSPAAEAAPIDRGKSLQVSVGLSPSTLDLGSEADILGVRDTREMAAMLERWSFSMKGSIRAPLRVGFGRRNDGQDNPPIAPCLPNQGPVPQGSNFVHHAHLSLVYREWLSVSGHYLSSWSPNDLQEVTQQPAREARMTVFGGEVHTDHPLAGNGYIGYSYVDAKRILPLSDGVQVLHGSTGAVFKDNYFGRLSAAVPSLLKTGVDDARRDDSGKLQSLLFQYIVRAAPFFGRTEPGPDLALAVFGMLNHVDATIRVLSGSHFDGKMLRFYGVDDLGTSSQDENQDPMFRLSDGAVLENVIIGDPAADGVHCYGSCTLKNVWWERVGEDAATFRGQQPDDVMIIDRGGASGAKDKVFQNNGVGTMVIKNFYVENFGKLYRSCGNCSRQAARTIVLENVTVLAGKKSSCLVGLNENYGDKAIFKGLNRIFTSAKPSFPVCQRFLGNARGLEPSKTTTGPDRNCVYNDATVVVE